MGMNSAPANSAISLNTNEHLIRLGIPLGEVTLKGIAHPVPAFNVTGLKT